MKPPISAGPSADDQYLRSMAEHFSRDGCVVIPNILTTQEAAHFRTLTDRYSPGGAEHQTVHARHISHHDVGRTFVLRFLEDLHPHFGDLAACDPIVRIAETVLGPGAALNTMNVIRNEPGHAITRWHVDDKLEIPLPPEIARFDARVRMPVFWMSIQIALSDIDNLENGPTQYVPGSHYSGRLPYTQEEPEFEGRGAVSVLCQAGDGFLTNHQTWHRGSPNTSDRTRYLMSIQYSQKWIAERFQRRR